MKNLIQNINKAFDHRIRLGIMSVLMVNESADFTMLKDLLGVTDGNLASHIKALESEIILLSKNNLLEKNQTPATEQQLMAKKPLKIILMRLKN